MMIDSSTIDRIREASDLVALVSETVELRPAGKELVGLCPFHNDTNPSLHINPDKQRWFCHPCQKGGDVFAFLVGRDGLSFPDAVRELGKRAGIEVVEERHNRSTQARPGITVAGWVRAKRLDPDLVRALNISDTIWKGAPAISFPYYVSGQDPEPTAVHIRRTLEKQPDVPRFEWRRGDRTLPYGLWLLPTSGAKQRGFVVLVEGESDFVSLLQSNIPVLGIPGNRWQESWSCHLEGIERVLVAVEPDDGGSRLLERAGRCLAHALDCCVEFIAHTSMATARSKQDDQYSARGAAAVSDNGRFGRNLWTFADGDRDRFGDPPGSVTDDDIANRRVLVLTQPKLSDGPPVTERVWLVRRGWEFQHLPNEHRDPDQIVRDDVVRLQDFLRSEEQRDRWHTKKTLEDSYQVVGLTRARLRNALGAAETHGWIVPAEIPHGHPFRKGGRTHRFVAGVTP
jgi:CHC2 zinc finger